MSELLNLSIKDIGSEAIHGLLEELDQVKGTSHASSPNMSLYTFLQLCQKDVVTDKKARIDAVRFYKGSALKTKVEDLDGDLLLLAKNIYSHFGIVGWENVEPKTLYVFLNDAFNAKSKLRKGAVRRW